MSSSTENLILKTLAYFDVFDYPLTKQEIWKYIISSVFVDKFFFEQALKDSDRISKKGDLYFLKGRESIVGTRIQRERASRIKMRIARRAARILSKIPTIQCIGVSGGLAMRSSDKDDDIDLFVIVSAHTLWTTRLISLLVLEFLGIRRSKRDTEGKDKICFNMIITEDALSLPGIKKDIYLAHEIIQMKPLINNNSMYQQFMTANKWITKYLFNSYSYKNEGVVAKKRSKKTDSLFEKVSRKVQLWSIRKHQTREIISDILVAFHPYDYGKKILLEYKRRLKQYAL